MLAPEPNTELGGEEAAAADCGPAKKGRVSRVYNGHSINNIVDRLNDLDSNGKPSEDQLSKENQQL